MKETNTSKHAQTERLFSIIHSQHQSEKSSNVISMHNQYVFKVPVSSNKIEIKKAVEYLFNVKVESVNTTTKHPKKRKFKNIMGTRKKYKKAYVKLEQGNQINLTEIT